MKITLIVTALCVGAAALLGTSSPANASPVPAMGSGDPYVDVQTGVTYTVYKPSYTAGLKTTHVGPNLAGDPSVEQNLYVQLGKSNGRNVAILEGNPIASDAGEGRVVRTVTIQGQKADVYAFCYPGNAKQWKNCSVADVSRIGGYLTVTLPASPGLSETIVEIETDGPKAVSAQQLIRIARGLRAVQ